MFSRLSSFKSLKNIILSSLFKNSGENFFFNSLSIIDFLFFSSSALNPKPLENSSAFLEPMFDVMSTITFLKLTTCPLPSVSLPSSNSCRNMLYTSSLAFSISSRRIRQCCLCFTASVRIPPFSYPTYPGFEPVSFEIELFSEYSLMSILTNASLSPKISSASFFARRVFPQPEGPHRSAFPKVFVLSPNPILFLFIILHISSIASS